MQANANLPTNPNGDKLPYTILHTKATTRKEYTGALHIRLKYAIYMIDLLLNKSRAITKKTTARNSILQASVLYCT